MKMKLRQKTNWEAALDKFLLKWKSRSEVIGALVSGSRVLGTDTKNSDIDVHIVLADHIIWRERGNCVIDNYIIEYFCNPIAQLNEYRRDDIKSFAHTDARMFALGRIIFDKQGALLKLQKEARKELSARFRKLSKAEIELGKYSLWDELDNLKDLNENKSIFYSYSHHLLLNRILELYRRYLGAEISSSSKLERFFAETGFCQKYGIREFEDKRFVKLFSEAVRTQSFTSIGRLVAYVLEQMGGFNIDGWKFRSKISMAGD